jgi:dTMP kinase
MAAGRFITIEGGEGAGKSTQIGLLRDSLASVGIDVAVTREPGGSPGAEEIRKLLLGGGIDRWDVTTEALLACAARRDHLVRTVWPALARGAWVISDRYEDSTRAYQGAGGLDRALIDRLCEITRDRFLPDLTLILDLPVTLGRTRAAARRGPGDRFEDRGDAFHERVREIFLAVAGGEPGRYAVIDASQSRETVAATVRELTTLRLGVQLPG